MITVLYTILQIIFAIILIFFLLFIANLIYNYENMVNIRNSYTVRREIPIFDGIVDFSQQVNWTFNTYNKTASSYKDLTPSINQNGGAEYTYNFWMYLNKKALSSITDADDLILLLRGSKSKAPYKNDDNCQIAQNYHDILVKNPLIRMKADGTSIIVEYNTVTSPDAYRENGKNAINCSGPWMEKNRGMLGIYNLVDYVYDKKWFMFTLVLKEINPDDDIMYKNKTSCKMYINGINVLDRMVESPYDGSYGSAAMKHNRGPLFVNPGNLYSVDPANTNKNPFATSSAEDSSLMMANLTYLNYAATDAEIMQLFNKKFSKKVAFKPVEDTKDAVGDEYSISKVSQQSNNLPIPF
jgi:hypothetical protein